MEKNEKLECLGICCGVSLTLIRFAVELSGFIFVCILSTISKNNPFENQLIDNLSNYFNFNDKININKDNNIFNNRFRATNHILNGNKTMPSDIDINKKLFLRKLVSHSFCSEMYDNFEKYRGTKLSNIFELNYDKIHKFSIITLIFSLGNFIFKIIFNICNCCISSSNSHNFTKLTM